MSIFFQLRFRTRVAQWVGLPNNSYNPITYTAWVPAQLCKLQKRVHLTSLPSDKVYQLLAQGQWFSPGTPASSTTKTGRQDIAEILLKVALNSINQSIKPITVDVYFLLQVKFAVELHVERHVLTQLLPLYVLQ